MLMRTTSEGIHSSINLSYFELNDIPYNNATGINGVEDGKAASVSGVFTIDGKLINDNGVTEGLKKGIHIVNGKKIMTK